MIISLEGVVRRINSDTSRIVLNVNGVGYEVVLPYFCLRALEDRHVEVGSPLTLEIYYHATDRQPKPLLIGFNKESERTFFEKLLDVEGVGPTRAARALVFSVSRVAEAIENEDIGFLTKMPEIGDRLARKMVATLRGKVAEWALLKDEGYATVPKAAAPDLRDEATAILVTLGYKKPEAQAKVAEAVKANGSLKTAEELIREVFRAERATE